MTARGEAERIAEELAPGVWPTADAAPLHDSAQRFRALSEKMTGLAEAVASAAGSYAGGDSTAGRFHEAVVDGLGQVRTLLESAADAQLRSLADRVSETLTVVTDIGDELSSFLSGLPSDADELDKLLSRQGELKALVRKYAPDIDGVIEWRETAERRLSEIDDPQGSIDELEAAGLMDLDAAVVAAGMGNAHSRTPR